MRREFFLVGRVWGNWLILKSGWLTEKRELVAISPNAPAHQERIIQNNMKKEINKDLEFLEEMHKYSQKLLKDKFDLVSLEHLDKMIEDWRDELLEKSNQNYFNPRPKNQ